jgi:exopolysaccharide biosynthesis protein
MNTLKITRFYVFVTIILFPVLASAQITGFNKIKWEKEKIAPGLKWKSSHTILNDSLLQNINILIIKENRRKISLVHSPLENTPTSKQAGAAGATAAINGGFFNVKTGGSVSYLKTKGMIVDSDTAGRWPRNTNLNGAIMIDSSGDLSIGKRMPNSWFDSHGGYIDVLVTGPLLLENRQKSVMPGTSLVTNTHPRSAVGVRGCHKVIFITVDGRDREAAGMTLYELAELMRLLKCSDAVNLDGGGSTTMWIDGKPFNGVVNMPSDNRKWDHEGERAVANILIVK